MTALRIAARPFTGRCALCGRDIAEELNTAVFALADDLLKTVCDTCAKNNDPDAYQALEDLRRLDERYWAIYNRDGWPEPEPAKQAAARYCAALAQGAAELMATYLNAEQAADTLRFLAGLTAEEDAGR